MTASDGFALAARNSMRRRDRPRQNSSPSPTITPKHRAAFNAEVRRLNSRKLAQKMAYAMDVPGLAQRRRRAGIEANTAEARAQAVRDFVMAALVTKADRRAVASNASANRATRRLAVAAIGTLAVVIRLGF